MMDDTMAVWQLLPSTLENYISLSAQGLQDNNYSIGIVRRHELPFLRDSIYFFIQFRQNPNYS